MSVYTIQRLLLTNTLAFKHLGYPLQLQIIIKIFVNKQISALVAYAPRILSASDKHTSLLHVGSLKQFIGEGLGGTL